MNKKEINWLFLSTSTKNGKLKKFSKPRFHHCYYFDYRNKFFGFLKEKDSKP